MRHSESIAQVAAALAAAQGKFPSIPKDRTVTVQPKPKKKQDGTEYWPAAYSFNYAPLDTILECVRPSLAEQSLALVQAVVADEKGAEFVRTTLLHASGEWFANDQPLFVGGGDNASQSYAAGLTYARRYGVTALLCVAADEDTDANGEDDDDRTPSRRGAPPAKPAGKPAPKASAPVVSEGEPGIHGLSDSQKRMLVAKAKAAGLEHDEGTEVALVEKFTRIDLGNINSVLEQLRQMTEARG